MPSHEDQVCEHAQARWLHTQAAHLPARERAALLARAAGHSTTCTAASLDTTPKAVELLTRRARQSLRARLLTAALLTGVLTGQPGPAQHRDGPLTQAARDDDLVSRETLARLPQPTAAGTVLRTAAL